jgi:hypothetical protein
MTYHVELPTGYATSWKQTSNKERGWLLEDAESRQGLSALMISLEGRAYIIEKAVVFAGSSLVSCWRGMQERQQP